MKASQLPHDTASEEAALGSLLIDDEAFGDVVDLLQSSDFLCEQNRYVFEAMAALYAAGIPIDQVSVSRRLTEQQHLDLVGGPAFLSKLVLAVPTSVHVRYYARKVQGLATMRRLIETAGKVAQLGYESQGEPSEVLAKAQTMLLNVDTRAGDRLVTPRQWAEAVMERHGELTRPTYRAHCGTGLPDLDSRFLGGLFAGEMVILAGGTGMGKSTLAYQIADHVAQSGNVVLFVSNEMTLRQLAERDIAMATGKSLLDVRVGVFDNLAEAAIMQRSGQISERSMYGLEAGVCNTATIRRTVERMRLSIGCHLVVIDYLGLLQDRVHGSDYGSDYQRVTEISHQLKAMARSCNVAVLAICQLSRHWDNRPDEAKRPRLSDLRDSGNLEQDADAVLFVWRWDMVYSREEWAGLKRRNSNEKDYPENQAELIVAKVRQGGRTGRIKLVWRPAQMVYGCKAQGA